MLSANEDHVINVVWLKVEIHVQNSEIQHWPRNPWKCQKANNRNPSEWSVV